MQKEKQALPEGGTGLFEIENGVLRHCAPVQSFFVTIDGLKVALRCEMLEVAVPDTTRYGREIIGDALLPLQQSRPEIFFRGYERYSSDR